MLSCAVRLLDMGFFRVGSEQYAEENGTFGLATIRKSHVTVSRDGVVSFEYVAKSGKLRERELYDTEVARTVTTLKRRRGAADDDELLAWQDGRRWLDVKSHDINDHVRELLRRRLHGQGLPDVGRDRAVRRRAGRVDRGGGQPDRAQEGRDARGEGGGRAPGQHARRLPLLLHRPARSSTSTRTA